MRQIIIKEGQGVTREVAVPDMSDDEILVRNHHSFVSIGTEISSVKNTGKALWERALENPEEVKKVFFGENYKI